MSALEFSIVWVVPVGGPLAASWFSWLIANITQKELRPARKVTTNAQKKNFLASLTILMHHVDPYDFTYHLSYAIFSHSLWGTTTAFDAFFKDRQGAKADKTVEFAIYYLFVLVVSFGLILYASREGKNIFYKYGAWVTFISCLILRYFMKSVANV